MRPNDRTAIPRAVRRDLEEAPQREFNQHVSAENPTLSMLMLHYIVFVDFCVKREREAASKCFGIIICILCVGSLWTEECHAAVRLICVCVCVF